jgi:hypothetical protein
MSRTTARLVQAGRILAREGVADGARTLLVRGLYRVERRLDTTGPRLPVHPVDVVDPARIRDPAPARPVVGRPARIGWVTTPPSPGSGGHTTLFRLVEAMERAGHECHIYLYDVYDGDVTARAGVIRRCWPSIRAEVHDVRDGLPDLDAWVATSWQTAHVLAARPEGGGHRFYLVQDLEPSFYPMGWEHELAAATYRFGFRGITAGAWLADVLAAEYGMQCSAFEFGTDHDVYHLDPESTRDGVVFYAKPDVPRRAFGLGVEALREFTRLCPWVPVHLYGAPLRRVPLEATSHGPMTPGALSALYNRCRVGLSLSLTNVSLVPWELLACGVVPVVNDAPHNRRVLDNEFVRWAPPSAAELAAALADAYEDAADPAVPGKGAASVGHQTWGRVLASAVADIEEVMTHAGSSR